MAYDPRLRASDGDRDRTAALLREHHAAGRLTAGEFDERLDQTFAAKTIGELEGLLSDLPRMDLYRLPDATLTRSPRPVSRRPAGTGHMSGGWRAAWGCYLTVNLVCLVVWGLSGFGYPWILWVAGPWGAVLAGSYLSAGPPRRRQLGSGRGEGELPPGRDRP
jgi:Domain of unknown function (DUF1707)